MLRQDVPAQVALLTVQLTISLGAQFLYLRVLAYHQTPASIYIAHSSGEYLIHPLQPVNSDSFCVWRVGSRVRIFRDLRQDSDNLWVFVFFEEPLEEKILQPAFYICAQSSAIYRTVYLFHQSPIL